MGDFRAAGIRQRKCRYATKQPGCPAQRHRHLVLQRRGLALGQACLSRRYRPRRPRRYPWKHYPSQQVSCALLYKEEPSAQAGGFLSRSLSGNKELIYMTLDWEVMSVDVTTTPIFQAVTPRLLFKMDTPRKSAPSMTWLPRDH